MENRKSCVLTAAITIAIGVFFAAQPVAAYEVNTHAYLTSEAIELYNKHTKDNEITDLKRFIIDGSIHEDDLPRPQNHFYDPINDEGLNDGGFSGQSAKEWVNDANTQGEMKYKLTNSSSLPEDYKKKIDTYGDVTNFTWNAAIRYWLKGDKEMAMEALGHVLHLVEDMGVPEHTRNDSHANKSAYEEYAKQYDSNTPDINLKERIGAKDPINLKSLGDYFDGLARYSNKYFYSPDSLGTYDFPELDYKNAESREGKYYIANKDDEGVKYYLAIKKNIANIGMGYADVFVDRDPILESYWSLLSVRTVRYSAGVIDLFFRDVEKAKLDPSFLREEVKAPGITAKISSIASTIWNGGKSIAVKTGTFFSNVFSAIGESLSSAGNFIGGLFTGDNGFTDIGGVELSESDGLDTGSNANDSVTPSKTMVKKDTTTKKDDEITALKLQVEQLQKEARLQDETVLQLEKKQVEPVEEEKSEKIQPEKKAETPVCSYDVINRTAQKDIVINEIAWMGGVRSASDEWIELKNISTYDVDISEWQLLNKGGGIKVRLGGLKNTVIKPGQFVLLERTDNNSAVGVTADLIYSGALGNTNDGLKLFDGSCGVVDEIVVASKWVAGNNDTKQTMERNTGGSGWHTSSSAGGTPKKENSAGITYSGGGGSSVSSARTNQSGVGGDPLSIAPQFYPIKINEVMYAFLGADGGREWIELYNAGTTAVDISEWKLLENDTNHGLTAVQGFATIPANGYAILADDKDAFLSDNPGYAGIIFDSVFSLSDNGETLALKNGTLTIDTFAYTSDMGADGDGKTLQKFADGWFAASSTLGQVNVKDIFVAVQDEADQNATTTEATSSQLIHNAVSGALSVSSYYQSLATSTSYSVGSFSIYGSGIAGKWKGGVCEFNPVIPRCSNILAQVFSDIAMPGGDTETLLTFAFDERVELAAGGLYTLFVEPTGNVHIKDRVSRVRGSSTNTYSGGSLSAFGQYDPFYISERVDPGLADMYFVISGETSIVAASTATTTPSESNADTGNATSADPAPVTPQFYPVVINEIMYDLAGSDEDREWIEVYNAGTTTVDVSTWKFNENDTNHGLMLWQGSGELPAGGYAIIAASSTAFLSDNPVFAGTLLDSTFSLSNTGEALALKNGDLVIDMVSYASTMGAQGNGDTLQRFVGEWSAASSTPGLINAAAPASLETEISESVTEVVGQSEHGVRSNPQQVTVYIQTLGKGFVPEIKNVEVYIESDQLNPWAIGVCRVPEGNATKCMQNVVASASTQKMVSEINAKTALTFEFTTPVVLDQNIDYAFYIKPNASASYPVTSVYGASNNSYTSGALFGFKGVEQLTLGVKDLYFAVNTPEAIEDVPVEEVIEETATTTEGIGVPSVELDTATTTENVVVPPVEQENGTSTPDILIDTEDIVATTTEELISNQ